MLKKGQKHLVWTPTAISVFQELKERFTSAAILCHPDPELEFIVEVDASSTSIGPIPLSDKVILSKYTSVHSTPVNSILRNRIMMWAIENFSP